MTGTNPTVRELLFETDPNAVAETRAKMEKQPTTADLKAEVAKKSKLIKWDVVTDVLMDRVVEMSDIPLAEILLPAWKKYHEIEKFGDPQAYPPEDTELVSLFDHTVKSGRKFSLEILFRRFKLKAIDFTVATELIVEGVVLRIKGGRIVAIEAGSVKGKASLTMEGQTVIEKPFATITLPGRIDLGEGVPLKLEETKIASSASAS